MAWDIGDVVRVSGYWTINGVAVDPGTGPTFKIKDPSGNILTKTYPGDAEVVKDGTGIFHMDVDIDESGTWHYRVYATGTGKAAEEGDIAVGQSEFP